MMADVGSQAFDAFVHLAAADALLAGHVALMQDLLGDGVPYVVVGEEAARTSSCGQVSDFVADDLLAVRLRH